LWEVDALLRRQLRDNIQNSQSTLYSFERLLLNLPNIPVQDDIQILISESLSSLNESMYALEKGDFEGAFRASQHALAAAEGAFFDPKMIAMLYFPDEHKYAIYTPLFVPICFPLLSGLWHEYKSYKNKRQQRLHRYIQRSTGS